MITISSLYEILIVQLFRFSLPSFGIFDTRKTLDVILEELVVSSQQK